MMSKMLETNILSFWPAGTPEAPVLGPAAVYRFLHKQNKQTNKRRCTGFYTLDVENNNISIIATNSFLLKSKKTKKQASMYRGSDPLGSGQLTLGWKTVSFSPVLQHEVLIQQV